MRIRRQSLLTGQWHEREIDVDEDALDRWERQGRDAPLIQDAFPGLSKDDREFILSGSTPEEFEAAFSDDDDEGAGDPDAPAF